VSSTSARESDSAARRNASAIAVERAGDILFLMAENGESSIADLARAIGSSGSVIHRILIALTRKGLVEQRADTERYMLSWAVLRLSNALVGRSSLLTAALPFMIELRDLTGETVCLGMRLGFDRIAIEQVEGKHELRWVANIGARLPLYAGATGKVLLAFMSDPDLENYLSKIRLTKLAPRTITDRASLKREIDKIRSDGYATSSDDRVDGLGGISAPILDRWGNAVACLTIAGRSDRMSPALLQQWAGPVTAAATKVSGLIGSRSAASTAGAGDS
jgi:DNA-binding IclR family transcriptional regulator